jgi:UDP-N-acetylmuramate dehydrogenase
MIENIPENQPLSPHCTFQTGGNADYLYILKDINEIPELIKFAKDKSIPYFIFGRGSNLLFDDKGFRGLIIKNETAHIEFNDDNTVTADSGVITATLVQESIKRGLSPLEKWIGLPGTIGGAVYGNSGCHGLETAHILRSVTIYNPNTDETQTLPIEELKYDYRSSRFKTTNEIILTATFQLEKSTITPEELDTLKQKSAQFRQTVQPKGLSSGSFFRNPSPEKPAGLLIDQAGLKGQQIKQAQISEKHANFILNLGQASTQDIKDLALLAREKVQEKFNINLIPEVQILDETGLTTL